MKATHPMNRRTFLAELTAALAAARCGSGRASAGDPPRILLRSSWQTVNIGDIGHTPGVIRLLGEHLPEAEVTLWPSSVGNGVEEMLRRNFPKLRFARSPEEVEQAFADVRLPAPRLRRLPRRAEARGPVAQGDRQALRHLRHHVLVAGRRGARADQRRALRLLPRLGLAGVRQGPGADLPRDGVRPRRRVRREPPRRRGRRPRSSARTPWRTASSSASSRACGTRPTG